MANTTIDILFHATRIRRVSEQIATITGYVRWLTTHRLVNPIKNKFLLDTVSLRDGFHRSATQKFERIRANSSTPSSSLPVENWIEFHRHRSWIDKSRPLERATNERNAKCLFRYHRSVDPLLFVLAGALVHSSMRNVTGRWVLGSLKPRDTITLYRIYPNSSNFLAESLITRLKSLRI